MSQSIFQVRPQDAGKGWAIDEYDGRGAWQSTYSKNANGEPLDKQEAQRRVFQLRRKALNSAKTEAPVNKAEVRRGGLYCTHPEPLASGFCPDCEQTVNPLPVCDACGHKELSHTRTRECMEWKCACERFEPGPSPVAEKSPNVASGSPGVAEKSPDECSICRGRHGSEVQHACE